MASLGPIRSRHPAQDPAVEIRWRLTTHMGARRLLRKVAAGMARQATPLRSLRSLWKAEELAGGPGSRNSGTCLQRIQAHLSATATETGRGPALVERQQ